MLGSAGGIRTDFNLLLKRPFLIPITRPLVTALPTVSDYHSLSSTAMVPLKLKDSAVLVEQGANRGTLRNILAKNPEKRDRRTRKA